MGDLFKWTVPFQLIVGFVDLGNSLKVHQLDQKDPLTVSL